jgi:Zn-finger nucleic acid-binding protein
MYEQVETNTCPKCKGVWLDEGELVRILQTKEKQFDDALIHQAIITAFAGVPADEKRSVENCPKCNELMNAINYSYASGVIIDRCCNNHGLWFDGNELEKIQAHSEHWEKETVKHQDDWLLLVQAVCEDQKKTKDLKRQKEMRPTKYLVNSIIRKMIGL